MVKNLNSRLEMSTATARTALELGPEGWKGFHLRLRRADPAAAARRRRAMVIAKKAGRLLHERFGARKVTVFGSILKPARFTRRSDIDLAVWGISDDLFYRAVAAVTGLSDEFRIDVIDAEAAPVRLKKAIDAESMPV
jgi:predicted nucleotidyltransferase